MGGATAQSTALRSTDSQVWIVWLKVAAWILIFGFALRFIFRDALPYFLSIDEGTYGPYWPMWAWLLPHALGGTVALLIGPFQFWSGFRHRYHKYHRWVGKIYLGGVTLGAAGAFYLTFHPTINWTFSVSLFGLATAWTTTAGMALLAIRKGLIDIHKEWMIRSYVVTFAFVTFRWLVDLDFIARLGTQQEVFTTIGWLCWIVPLFFTEVILQLRHMRKAKVTG